MDTSIDKLKGHLHCIIIHFSDYLFSTSPLCYNKIIIYMANFLDSDWLRSVQFKCDISAKSVTAVQFTHHNSALWLPKDNRKFSTPMISHKMVAKVLCRKNWRLFLQWEKMSSRKIFRHFLHPNFAELLIHIGFNCIDCPLSIFNILASCRSYSQSEVKEDRLSFYLR